MRLSSYTHVNTFSKQSKGASGSTKPGGKLTASSRDTKTQPRNLLQDEILCI